VVAFRVFMYVPSPPAEALTAALRVELGECDEERPTRQEVILRSPLPEPKPVLERLVRYLERYHPQWRQFISLSTIARTP
jgi:hypothetical protein